MMRGQCSANCTTNFAGTCLMATLSRLESEGGQVVGVNRVLTVPLISARDLHEIRITGMALEGMATRTTVEHMTSKELASVTWVYSEMGAAAGERDVHLYFELNWSFRSKIYHVTHDRLLINFIENLWLRVGPLIQLAIPSPGHFTQSMQYYWATTQVLIRGDAEAATGAIESGISEVAVDWLRVLEIHRNEERGVL